jgi:MYXO-CTERM domain-containing protein
LFDRGNGLIFDDVLNVTWLADWNFARTSQYDTDGNMTWDSAMTWAETLVYAGHTNWRLPTAINIDGSGPCGPSLNCAGSELGHMFYKNWAAIPGQDFSSAANVDYLALFRNVGSIIYWTGTESKSNTAEAWFFGLNDGFQNDATKRLSVYAVAVHPGDISAVPEPHAALLGLIGLAALPLLRTRPRRRIDTRRDSIPHG